MNFNQLQIALWTLVRKEVRRFLRILPQPYYHLQLP